MNRIENPIDRFWRKVEKGDGCWLWFGVKFERGYGRFNPVPTETVRAHRYAWEITNGPIPDGLIVCHHCDTPLCVKPAHLFLGTHKDNAQDRERKGRGDGRRRRGALHPMAKISEEDAADIKAGMNRQEAARKYGISPKHVDRIRRGECW